MQTLEDARKLITSHPDFPKAGITFFDIHPVMRNAEARKLCIDTLYERYKGVYQPFLNQKLF